jgi:hypothetical protein
MIIANVACNVHGCVVACEQKKVKDGAPGRSVCFGGKRGGTLNSSHCFGGKRGGTLNSTANRSKAILCSCREMKLNRHRCTYY